MIAIEKYKEISTFPSRNIDPREKGAEYCRKNAEVVYGLYLNNKTAWGYGHNVVFDRLRRYSTGKQDENQYKTYLLDNYGEEEAVISSFDSSAISKMAKRQGWMNVMWDNLSPAPRILNALLGKMEDVDYDIYVDTIDSDSRGLAEQEKYRKFHEARDFQWQKEFKQRAGIPIDEDISFPASKDELDSFSAQEGFKLNIAKTMQKLLRHSFEVSDWKGTIARKTKDDLVVIGYGATRDYYDDEECRFRTKWLDPARTVIQHSHEFDYRDSEYAGYFSLWTISNLRRKTELTEEQLYDLAMRWKGQFGNPTFTWDSHKSALDPSGLYYGYDDYKVWVFEAEWIDTDTHKRLSYKGRHGRKSYVPIDFGEKVEQPSKRDLARGVVKEEKQVKVRQVYQCHWIVGSDHVFDYGPVNMAPRPQPSKPKLTFHVEQLLQPSLIEQLRTILDQIAITWLRHQNSLAQMVEPGYAINTHMLMGVTLGGKKMDPAEVLKMWKQTGILPYSYGVGGAYSGGAALPVTPITGGMGTRVQETAQSLEILFGLIEKITGINPVAIGGSPSGGATLGETELSVQAMSDVLRPIMSGFLEIKKSNAESLLNRLQIGIRVSEKIRKSYAGVSSPNDIENVKISEGNGVMYGFQLKPKPDLSIKRTLVRFIELSLENSRAGIPGLSTTEALGFIMRLERGEDVEQIRQEVGYTEKKAQEREQMLKERNIQLQNEGLAQIEQQKAQNQAQTIALEGQAKTQEEIVRGQIKERLATVENNYAFMDKLYEEAMQAEGRRNTNTKNK